jgi:hypothetical protein
LREPVRKFTECGEFARVLLFVQKIYRAVDDRSACLAFASGRDVKKAMSLRLPIVVSERELARV